MKNLFEQVLNLTHCSLKSNQSYEKNVKRKLFDMCSALRERNINVNSFMLALI